MADPHETTQHKPAPHSLDPKTEEHLKQEETIAGTVTGAIAGGLVGGWPGAIVGGAVGGIIGHQTAEHEHPGAPPADTEEHRE